MSEENKPKKLSVGGLWKRTGEYGEFLSGQITLDGKEYNFTASPNKYKFENPEAPYPDFRIFLKDKKGQKTAAKTVNKPVPKARPVPQQIENDPDEGSGMM